MSFSFLPIAQALRTCVTKACRSSSLPIADPPPVGGHTGATSEPTTRLRRPMLSASFFRSSSVESMLTCGSKRKRSTPSNLTPFTSAFAVWSSIVSRSIGGSAPGPPLPTRPGHIALWIAGYLCIGVFSWLFDRPTVSQLSVCFYLLLRLGPHPHALAALSQRLGCRPSRCSATGRRPVFARGEASRERLGVGPQRNK